MSGTRIYHVEDDDAHHYLVRATSQAQALRHVAGKTFTVEVATQDQIVNLVQAGQPVEDASSNQGSNE